MPTVPALSWNQNDYPTVAPMRLEHTLFLLALAAALPPAASAADSGQGQKIQKCQDAAGRWHYGDTAAEECAKSKVIEITGKGVPVKEIAAPLTAEQLKEREQERQEKEQEQRRNEDRARRDKQLLATYGHEDDVIQTRDRKLAEIDSQVRASTETLTALRAALARYQTLPASEPNARNIAKTQGQIAKQEAFIQGKAQEKENARQQYQAELERFREIKSRAAPTGAAPPKIP